MGKTLTSVVDKLTITSDTFLVSTRSIVADSVLSRSSYSYLGRIKDPETASYISADFMTQFSLLEEDHDYLFPEEDSIMSRDDQNLPIADSCTINLLVEAFMGDSLAAMKMRMSELAKPVEENRLYYTNFDLAEKGYLRSDGISKNKLYSISDLTVSDSIRAIRQASSYYEVISISLNEPYTDQQGKTYNNYGTYLLRNYYAHPDNFRNSQTFIRKICPGFYFQTTDGLGMMAEINQAQLNIHYRMTRNGSTINRTETFSGTKEVLQTTHFTYDKENARRLAAIQSHTYLKAPDGIFTEVTLPVEAIKRGHETDTIASAKIMFRRMNNISDLSDDVLQEPQNLLMVQADSLFKFFENRNLPTNVTSFLATFDSSKNSYTFNNISGLINHMYANRNKNQNWNKVVLVPVQVTYTSTSSSSSSRTVASINNELRATSIRLVGGSQNQHDPIRISVVYNQNN